MSDAPPRRRIIRRTTSVSGLPAAPAPARASATRSASPVEHAAPLYAPSAPPPPPKATPVKSTAAPVGSSQPRPQIDRAVFSSINYSTPAFVNNISNRVLFPLLLRQQQQQQRPGAVGGNPGASAGTSKLRGSDGGALFNNDKLPVAARKADEGEAESVNYRAVAAELSATLDDAAEQVAALLANEEASLQKQEVRCKRVEIHEKRQLATVRLGLEATTTRLQEYENRVSNAQAAIAGIEQHLSQSNARVQRGKSVSQLLSYFKMFTKLKGPDLSAMLKSLSKARVGQRTAVTNKWRSGRVSQFAPRYYTTVVDTSGTLEDDHAVGGGPPASSATARASEESIGKRSPGSPGIKTRSAYRTDRGSATRRQGTASSRNSSVSGSRTARRAAESPGRSEDPERSTDEDGGDDGVDEVDADGNGNPNLKLHRAEAAAVAGGLERLFAVRSCTEAQVEWCQRIALLATEVGNLTANVSNVETYITWLRQELVADMFHVVKCFDDFYDENPQTAVHQSYGRALLKTLELVSRLYTTLTPSNDSLLSVFFTRSVNDLGVTLFSEYSPRPLPNQPPLPNPTSFSAMDHYRQHTDGDLKKTFAFLLQRVQRDVVVVETIFGISSTARQQLLSQVVEGVVKPLIVQQNKLAQTFETFMLNAEANLSPRTKRRCGARVVDAIEYHQTIVVRFFSFFEEYVAALRKMFDQAEVEFLTRFTDVIFVNRAEYSQMRTELSLLERQYTLIDEKYTRSLHPATDEFFDLREAHMTKTRELMDCLAACAKRVKTYAYPKDVGPYVGDLIRFALKFIGSYLDGELRKTLDSIRADRDNWQLKPIKEEYLLKPPKPESQLCGFRMLLFAQSSLMSLNDVVAVICMPIVPTYPRLVQDIEDARNGAFDLLDERAERLLNMCAQAIIIRSLAILMHYQNSNDYAPKDVKGSEEDAIAPPCTRACTLFCYYLTRQLEEAKEFIALSNGQLPQRQTASQMANGAVLNAVQQSATSRDGNDILTLMVASSAITSGASAIRARARTMNLQQLLFGDGGPSSFVRTIGVCLYRGISAHLKSFTANDRGALIYKQDVSAYKEAVQPLTSTPGLGGAVVEVLFQILKETSSLLIMPLDHIKEVKESGMLKLLSNDEKSRYLRIRQDVRAAFKIINH